MIRRSRLRVWVARLTAWFTGRRLDADLNEEMDFHLAMLVDQHMAQGMPRDAATRRARLDLGNPAVLLEDHRDHRSWPGLGTFLQDLRFAARQFRRSPTFTAAALITIAFGIGVDITVFNVFSAVALKRLPVADASRAVRLERWFETRARGDVQFLFSFDEYRTLRDRLNTVTNLVTGSRQLPLQLPAPDGSDSQTLYAQFVSPDFFHTLGARAALGRVPAAAEIPLAGTSDVIFLSDAGWRNHFAANPTIAGTSIVLNGATFIVAGVAAPEFIGIGRPPEAPDFWVGLGAQPILLPASDWQTSPAVRPLEIVAYLPDGASLAAASARTGELAPVLLPRIGDEDRLINLTLEPAKYFGETNDPRFVVFVVLVAGTVGLILLAACANLANMLLARSAGRAREIAVRVSLGATPLRIIRQLLVESILLSVAGGGLALVAASWTSGILWRQVAGTVRGIVGGRGNFAVDLSVDGSLVLVTVAIAVVAGVIFGLAPARQLARTDVVRHMADPESTSVGLRRSRLRSGLVALQVALSVVLVIVAGLLGRGSLRAMTASTGLDTRHLYAVDSPSDPAPERAAVLQRTFAERLRSEPGIAGVALADIVPFTSTHTEPIFAATPTEGSATGRSSIVSLRNDVSASYFPTLGIPTVAGRLFSRDEELDGAPVAVMSRNAAAALFPGVSPLGKRVQFSEGQGPDPTTATVTVIGVVGDARTASVSRLDAAVLYTPTSNRRAYRLIVRSPEDPASVTARIRRIAAGLAPRSPGIAVLNLEDRFVRQQRILPQAASQVSAVFAGLAWVLAATGIYGVIAFLAGQQTREIGIRVALGATSREVIQLVLRRGLAPVAVGVIMGLAAAAGICTLVASLLTGPGTPDVLFGLSAFDPLTFAVATASVVLMALAAAAAPAVRASRVDPLRALR